MTDGAGFVAANTGKCSWVMAGKGGKRGGDAMGNGDCSTAELWKGDRFTRYVSPATRMYALNF